MRNRCLVCIALLCAALAACGQPAGTTIAGSDGSIRLLDGVASIRIAGQPEARVHGDGTLNIDHQPVALSADQRDLLQQYYVDVYKIGNEGMAAGKAGAALAGKAAGAALSGAANGDAAAQLRQQAAAVTSQAAAICDNLEQLRHAQDAVAEQVPAFRPYATLDENKIAKCRQGIDTANHALTAG